MVKSMTGYGRESIKFNGKQIHVEVRSVNHRFLDLSPKIPKNLLFLEEKMKRLIKDKLSRGRVDLWVTIDGEGWMEKELTIDWKMVDQYIEKLQEIKSRYELTGDISIDMVTKLDQVFTVQEIEKNSDDLQNTLLQAMDQSLEHLVFMRKDEGARLAADLKERATAIDEGIEQLELRRPQVVEEYKQRIRSRIETYTKEELNPEESRILQEVGLLAEKGDVTEELTRLRSHLEQFTTTLQRNEPIGRKLDFIVQEMHREVNTIGSKSNDHKISEWVVSLKSEIEKMKEQVQNVE